MVNQQRDCLAEIVVVFSLLGLAVISGFVIFSSNSQAITVFNAVLPLFGTWVGTVLAYYFSRSNFSAAASAYKNIAASNGSDITVTTAMIDKAKIAGLVVIGADQTDAEVNLKTAMLDKFTTQITRIPVVNAAGAVKYIIHESTLNKFITTNTVPPLAGGFDVNAATLQQLLGIEEFRKLATTFAIVASSAKLSDAKAKMDEMPNCEDVFVTQTGLGTESMLGWITDATLASHARV